MRSAGSTHMGLGHREQQPLSGSPHGTPPQKAVISGHGQAEPNFQQDEPWPEGGVLQCTGPVPSR